MTGSRSPCPQLLEPWNVCESAGFYKREPGVNDRPWRCGRHAVLQAQNDAGQRRMEAVARLRHRRMILMRGQHITEADIVILIPMILLRFLIGAFARAALWSSLQ